MARKSNDPMLPGLDDAPAAVPEDAAVVARRERYRALLAEKLKDPEFRKIEGFPVGTDEAILALSDPPHYTACPNPFLAEWLAEKGTPYYAASDTYHREPFAADVSEGKNHPIYNAHSYHTKVPHRAIMRYILHYTQPDDVVYDGFCGTGMTGVAAQLCGNSEEVEALGYVVKGNAVWEKDAWEARQAIDTGKTNPHKHLADPQPFSRLGSRKAVLNDLSPTATFITYNYNTPLEANSFEQDARGVLDKVEGECGWMYATLHGCSEAEAGIWAKTIAEAKSAQQAQDIVHSIPASKRGVADYYVWSEVFACPHCAADVVFWDCALDPEAGEVREEFPCPSCRTNIGKKLCTAKTTAVWDTRLKQSREQVEYRLVSVVYSASGRRHTRAPQDFDFALSHVTRQFSRSSVGYTGPMMGLGERWGDTWRAGHHLGITHTHHFFTERNFETLSSFFRGSSSSRTRVLGTAVVSDVSRMSRVKVGYYFRGGGGPFIPGLAGTLYIPSMSVEKRPLFALSNRIGAIAALSAFKINGQVSIRTGSASGAPDLPSNSIDYIFTDPPFGQNIQYAELNSIIEEFLEVRTNSGSEAVVNTSRASNLEAYTSAMLSAFREYFRTLKPGRWMTVEFHNSSNMVWQSIQRAIELAGFVLADVRILDKQQYGFNQLNASAALKKDLVLSCYKPTSTFERMFAEHEGLAAGVEDFVEQHLAMLPVTPVTKAGELERLAERTTSILYDRMIAYHLVRGALVPMSSSEFSRLLHEHYVGRDDMWFLPGQEVRYDLCKLRGIEVEQQVLFVSDERSAVSWLRGELGGRAQSLGDLTTKFMQATKEWPDQEPRPELRDLLRDWFVEVDGRWANPNPDDEKHVEALRKKSMLRLFSAYAAGKGKLKEYRREALIEAFRYCWNTGQEQIFVAVCQRIPDKLLREDAQLSEAYDLAADRVISRPPQPQLEFEWE